MLPFWKHFASIMEMKTLTIKNVPDEIYDGLVEEARENRRSLNNEALIRLERTLDQVRERNDLVAEIDQFRDSLPKSLWVTDVDLRESRNELERRTDRFVAKNPKLGKKGVRSG